MKIQYIPMIIGLALGSSANLARAEIYDPKTEEEFWNLPIYVPHYEYDVIDDLDRYKNNFIDTPLGVSYPEPSSFGLISAVGLAGILARRQKR